MAIQSLEIQDSGAEPENPALERAPSHTHAVRNAGERHAIDKRLAHRIHNDLDTGDLAWQRVAGQDTLAMQATATARQRHRQRYECVAGLEPSLDPTASQPERALVTRRAPTTEQQLIAGTVDGRGVAARLNIEYEDHVLMTAPG
jgi:hypothetical protein